MAFFEKPALVRQYYDTDGPAPKHALLRDRLETGNHYNKD